MDILSFKAPNSDTSNLFVPGVLMLMTWPWNDPLVLGLRIGMTGSSALGCHAAKQWRSPVAQPHVLDGAEPLKQSAVRSSGLGKGGREKSGQRQAFSHFCAWTTGLCHCRSRGLGNTRQGPFLEKLCLWWKLTKLNHCTYTQYKHSFWCEWSHFWS